MKAKHVFTALGLVFVMGAGVAIGIANNRNIEPAKAAVDRTVYCAIDTTTLGSYTLKLNCNVGDNDTWVQTDMVDLNDTTTYAGKKVFSGTFSERYGGVDAMQFQLYDGSTWKAQDQVISSWTTSGNYADKLHIYGGEANSWETYSALPTHTYSYSINNGAYVDMVDNTAGEVMSSTAVSLAVDDIITFQKDDVDLAVGGKRNSKVVNDSSYELRVIAAGSETLYLDTSTDELWAGQYSISDGYYVAGTMTNWVDTRYLIPMTEDSGVYTSNTFAAETDEEFKIIHLEDDAADVYLGVKDNEIYTTTSASAEYNSSSTNAKITADGNYYVKFTASEIDNGYVPYVVEDADYVPDVPSEDGYYICSSVLGWTYSNAIQMLTESEYLAGNAACYFGYVAVAGEELRVRSYLNGVDSWYQSGDQNTDNYTFASAGTYDIYLNTGTPAMYYITDHVVRHNVTIKGVLYQGKDFDRVVTAGTLEAQEGTTFDRLVEDMPVVSGYSAYGGLFTDQALTTSYVPKEITSDDVVLYCRYIRNGVYVAGDEAFSGSSVTAWDILGAVYFTDECQDSNNAYEGVITIPASASSENPVACRPLSFSGSITWLSAYTIGTTYSFCSKVGDNIEFTEGGTYAVYVNQSYEVYFNIGVDAFYTKFLTEVQSVCNGVLNETKDITDLQSVWADQKAAYQALSATDQATIVAKTIDGGDENGSDLEKVIAKYSYIVHKYGTNVCEDFIWGQTYVAQSNGFNLINNNNAIIIIAVSISVVAISAVGLFFIIRRKRLVK